MKYEVTIGIPVYESAPYIRRALMSALNQTYPSIEFLVVDDCGEDGSVAIIREIADARPVEFLELVHETAVDEVQRFFGVHLVGAFKIAERDERLVFHEA